MLISYIIDGDGYLITIRSIIPEDIEDFQYTPKPEFDVHIQIFNEKEEGGLLKRFVMRYKVVHPNVFVSLNRDIYSIYKSIWCVPREKPWIIMGINY